MTVKYIRTTFLSIPFTNPPRWSVDYNRPREILVVEIETASGVTGMDYLMVLSGGLRTIQACIEELVAPVVLGRSIGSVEAIWQDIWQATYWFGRMGVSVFTQSAIDIALWDALGKHATDVANVAAMRDALGEDIAIMVDVNMGWRVDEAIMVTWRLDKYNIRWLEESVVVADFAGYFRIADALRTRVVGGESQFTHYDLAPFFDNPKLPILQPDMMGAGSRKCAGSPPWHMPRVCALPRICSTN